jgi:hypothetical protein
LASVDFQQLWSSTPCTRDPSLARCKRGMSIRHTPYEYEFRFAKGHYGKSI